VLNLDRQPDRWKDMERELHSVVDAEGKPLSERAVRYSACDALEHMSEPTMIRPFYTLSDQLYVEPQPLALPDAFDLERPIKMSPAEIAIARSHINIWKAIAASTDRYSLVLEDDVEVDRRFGRTLDGAWSELEGASTGDPTFDILYVSYEEVRDGAPKEFLSAHTFRPERGLWFMSGYILSKKGAQALIDLLPCCGPIDLWLNLNFAKLNVRALRSSVFHQRRDLPSTNSYSILPALSQIGVLDNGRAALFHGHPRHTPVFAFGPPGSGLSSLAMALSMLGYRCCSDFDRLPPSEFKMLMIDGRTRVFDAYVNIGSLESELATLVHRYPRGKYIWMSDAGQVSSLADATETVLQGVDLLLVQDQQPGTWRILCEFLRIAPPHAPYPRIPDIGQLVRRAVPPDIDGGSSAVWLRHDDSPWVVDADDEWRGMDTFSPTSPNESAIGSFMFEDHFERIDASRWFLRNDTFSGNLALFRPENVLLEPNQGLSLVVKEQVLGVRALSAGAISSRSQYRFGRFEATLQATDIAGLVTGFFLHRNCPRQEIDIEIRGNRPDRLLVNVFYNPGTDGTRFDYGYRGTPFQIDLGFDASKAVHQYAIEWESNEIRWYVDQKLVHRRAIWGPTPIPNLPMTLHVNTWPTNSKELAGTLKRLRLPTSSVLHRVSVIAQETSE
jgi:GR25 family glycosyltransferase involved in LPS biosynthesis